ncbi:fatty-acid amide hydrolase 2-A-like [Diaphorina citri]|uniref:Fatty-acid amide hydrolase 2-A-like n=1 Tax=Diaphorina citri TaxID=121845 RepID=A0A3Q0J0P7_DIACI|nr:fatty-acid amide hydrolase 2-A-like [Diaphorina citri]
MVIEYKLSPWPNEYHNRLARRAEGLSNATGALKLKGRKASEDAPIVKILREAGAIPLCNTNVPELCTSWETTNYITGKTVNPYDFSRTPGGSSGGEAALISSAASVIGIGSDLAGSIRVPAMFTGIFGHKPSPGRSQTSDYWAMNI